MKRISFIVMACALMMTLSQCKKEQQTLPENTNESVTITLDVKGGNGSRVGVNPADGTVSFENGDKIYVACAGKYVGTLTHNGTYFVGTVTNAVTDSLLRFYFLGNVEPSETLVPGTTTSCSIDISDQSDAYSSSHNHWHLPVVSYGSSNEPFGTQTMYSAYLYNKCALVKFRVLQDQNINSQDDIYLSGMNHLVTIGFGGDSFEYGKYNEGFINIGKGTQGAWVEKWVILLPQDGMEGEDAGAYINNELYGYRGAVPAISPNSFLTEGIVVYINEINVPNAPVGAIAGGLFSINNSQRVWFSQGNLANIGTDDNPTWKFADNQWNYNGSNLLWDRASVTYTNIINAGAGDSWYTLSKDEWSYITHGRETLSGVRYAKATVEGVTGLLIFPDNWKSSVYTINDANVNTSSFASNIIDADAKALLVSNGVVFLPIDASYLPIDATFNKYWTSSLTTVSNRAYSLDVTNSNLSYGYSGVQSKLFIRLVQDFVPGN